MEAASDRKKSPPKRSRRFRVLKWMLIAAAGVVLAIVIILPAYLSSPSGKKLILSKISRAVDGEVDAKTLSVGWFKGIRLTDLTFSDHKGMMSVSVREISAKPQLMAMLRGNLALGKTLLDAPRVVINVQDPGTRPKNDQPSKSDDTGGRAALGLAMLDLEIQEGNATINLVRKDTTQSVHFRNIASKVNLNPLGQKSTFDLTMAVVEDGKESQITAHGSMKQSDKKKWTLKGTTGDFKVTVDKLELSTLTPLFVLMGKDIQTSGQLNANADVRIEKGRFEQVMAKAQLRNFKSIVAGKETVVQEPVIIDADVSSTDGVIRIERLNFESSFCNVRCKGTGNVVDYDATADLAGLQDFAGQLADFGEYRLQGKAASTGKVSFDENTVKVTFDLVMDVVEGDKESRITALGSMKQSDKKKWAFKGTTGDFKVNVDNLELSSLTPLFALTGKDIKTSGQLNADADVIIEKGKFERIIAKAQLRNFKSIVAGKETVVQEPVIIDADVSSTDGVIRIERLNFESSFCNVLCSGTGNVVDYDATAKLTGLQDFAGQLVDFGEYRLQGNIASTGKVAFGENTVKVTGRGLTEGLVIRKGDLATEATTANLGFDIQRDNEKNITKIASVKVLADLGRIEITDAVIPDDLKQGTVSLGLSADVDLRKLQPFVALTTEIPEGVTFAGRLVSEAAIDGKDGRFHIKTDRTNVKKLVINTPGQDPFRQETIKLVADLIADTKQKEITVNDLFIEGVQGQSLIKVTKGKFEQSEKGQKTHVAGQLQAEYDLAAVSALAAPFLPRGLAMEGIRRSDLTFNSQYPTGTDRLLANINGKTNFGFDKAQYMGLNFAEADLKLQATKGLLALELPATAVNEGRIGFEGNVNFKEKPMTLRMAKPSQLAEGIKINDEMTRRLLMYINPLFANQADVTGIANFHCEKMSIPLGSKTFADDLEITGTIEIADVVLKPRGLFAVIVQNTDRLHVMPTRFVLEKGFLSYDDMLIHVGNNPLNFSGRIGLDKTIDMKVTFPWTVKGRTARVGEDSAMRITAVIGGTLDRPSIDMKKVLEEAGRKFLEEQLDKTLEKALERIFR